MTADLAEPEAASPTRDSFAHPGVDGRTLALAAFTEPGLVGSGIWFLSDPLSAAAHEHAVPIRERLLEL